MKFFNLLALVAVTAAADPIPSAGDSAGDGSATGDDAAAVGRDRLYGETCIKSEDRCNAQGDEKQDNMKCCHLMITLLTTNKNAVCVDTQSRNVTISDGTGLTYGYNCNYEGGALNLAISGVAAVAGSIYLFA